VINAGAYVLTWSFRFSYPTPAILLINESTITEIAPQSPLTELFY